MKFSFTKILNYLGLTIAFSAFAIIMVQVKWDVTFAKGYPDSDRLYRVELALAKEQYWVHCPRLLFEEFHKVPEIELVGIVNLEPSTKNIRRCGSTESSYITKVSNRYSQDALDILGVELVDGVCNDADSLVKILITTDLADILYPDESAIGKMFEDENNNTYTISGVYRPLVENGVTPRVDFIETLGKDGMFHLYFNYSCIIKIAQGVDVGLLEKQLHSISFDYLSNAFNGANALNDEKGINLRLTQLHDVHYVSDTQHDMVPKSNQSTLYTLMSIAVILLLVAMINYLNISMAEVPTKIKGLNTRKVLGASQLELIWIQCRDSLKVAVCAVITSMLIVYLISLTNISDLIDGSILPSDNIGFYTLLAIGAIAISILSGLYPAIYGTSFPPAIVLKGNFSHTDHGRTLRNALIGLQVVVSFILIIFAFFVQVQMDYMKNHDKGYRSNDVLYSQIPWGIASKNRTYREMLINHPEIQDVTFSAFGLCTSQKGTDYGMMTNYKEYTCDFDVSPVEYNFTDFFDIPIIEGRSFNSEDNNVIIFNDIAKRKWELETGTGLMIEGTQMAEIVGIAKDFNFRPLQYAISPIALFRVKRKEAEDGKNGDFWNWTNIYIKKSAGVSVKEVSDILYKEAANLDSNVSPEQFYVTYLDEQSGKLYEKEETLGNLVRIACILSGLIAIIGILGLVHYETQYRRKEIAIRRVLGGETLGLILKFNKIYVNIALICFFGVIPISWWIISQWLKDYPYQSPIPFWIFIAGFLILMAIIVLTVSTKCYKTATENPLNSLKSE